MTKLLGAVLVVGGAGLMFSGYLGYRELFTAAPAPLCAPVGASGTVLGAPPCIYGFFMYLIIVVLTSIALLHRRKDA